MATVSWTWNPKEDHRKLALGLGLHFEAVLRDFLAEVAVGPSMDVDGMFKDYLIRKAGEREAKPESAPPASPASPTVVWSATGRIDVLGQADVELHLEHRVAEHGPQNTNTFRLRLPLRCFREADQVAGLWGKPVSLLLTAGSEVGALAERAVLAEEEAARLRALTKVLSDARGVQVARVEMHPRSCIVTAPGGENDGYAGLTAALGQWVLDHGGSHPNTQARIAKAEQKQLLFMHLADTLLGWLLSCQEDPENLPGALANVAKLTRENPRLLDDLRRATEAVKAQREEEDAPDSKDPAELTDDAAPDSE